jgi:hypothetical protein
MKLKACPFCGVAPREITAFVHISHELKHKKSCWFSEHDKYVTYIFKKSHNTLDAIKWNRRASEANKVEVGK